jgi:hypothetical protein
MKAMNLKNLIKRLYREHAELGKIIVRLQQFQESHPPAPKKKRGNKTR